MTESTKPGVAIAEKRHTEQPIMLRFGDPTQVEVLGEDQDRFYTTVSDAAYACKRADNLDRWFKQVKDFLSEINAWCQSQAAIVSACYVAWSDEHYNVIVVTHGDDYRFEFDDRITDLNLRLAGIYCDIPVDAIQIPEGPEGSLYSFINPEKAMQPYGQPGAARRKGSF
jgi:hypothetical protein